MIMGRANIGEGLSKSCPQSWLSNRLPVFGVGSVCGVDMVGPRAASTNVLYDGYGARAGTEPAIVYTPEPIILRAEIRLELPLKRKAVYLESQLAKSQ